MTEADNKVLTTVELPVELGQTPTVEAAAQCLQLDVADIDQDFGVVSIDPERCLFAAMIREEKLDRPGVGRRFSDPMIAPFGRPRSK